MVFETLINPILSPLLKLGPFSAILVISLIVSFIIVLAYKWLTDQNLMKQLKGEIKELQREMKELKGHPEKAMAVQKKAMETNTKYMLHSLKPTIITFIPIILIFGWLNANLAYEPIMPGQEFTVSTLFQEGAGGEITLLGMDGINIISNPSQEISNRLAVWTLEGEGGVYALEFKFDNKKFTKEIIITRGKEYAKVEERYAKSPLKSITINNRPIKPLGDISIFGWKPGWLGIYIIFSIIFSMALRKALKVY